MLPRFVRRGRRAARHSDAGASLILVLALVMFIGLISTAILNYAGSSILSAERISERVDTVFDTDGALKAAINSVRMSSYPLLLNGSAADPTKCFPDATGQPTDAILTFPGLTSDRNVTVGCAAVAGTGGAGQPALQVAFTASTGGRVAGTATAQFNNDGPTPIAGNRTVGILAWQITR